MLGAGALGPISLGPGGLGPGGLGAGALGPGAPGAGLDLSRVSGYREGVKLRPTIAGRLRVALCALTAEVGALVGACAVAACGEPPPAAPEVSTSPVIVSAPVDDKAKLYNIVGRWYPQREVERLRDDTLTPTEWCKRAPMRLAVLPDGVEVTCADGRTHAAAIARVRTSTRAGETIVVLRSGKDGPLRQLRFEDLRGPTVIVSGSPCDPSGTAPYQRFPEYEIMTRQILGGKRCSQLEEGQGAAP